jgi:hypothetical protein
LEIASNPCFFFVWGFFSCFFLRVAPPAAERAVAQHIHGVKEQGDGVKGI